jgi:uncharacterized membrane protein YeaQ/YmgE (transglycosylase-associated protein family)
MPRPRPSAYRAVNVDGRGPTVLILTILVLGLAAGWFANILVGGGRGSDGRPDWGKLLIVGLAGSFLGGVIGSLLAGDGFDIHLSGIIGSIVGATILLLIMGVMGRQGGGPRRAH